MFTGVPVRGSLCSLRHDHFLGGETFTVTSKGFLGPLGEEGLKFVNLE